METIEYVKIVCKVLSEKKAEDIKTINISDKSSFADYFVIATGTSVRQINNLVDYIEDELIKSGLEMKSVEGLNNSEWILLDFGDVIVNLFTQESREKYDLEKVWGDCIVESYN